MSPFASKKFQEFSLRLIESILAFLALGLFVVMIYDIGFLVTNEKHLIFRDFFLYTLFGYLFFFLLRIPILIKRKFSLAILTAKILVVVMIFLLLFFYLYEVFFIGEFSKDVYLKERIFIYITISLIFFIELSKNIVNIYHLRVNPLKVFLGSFLGLIFFGALLLYLPNSTVKGISFIDSLFTSTSAVCVTGLTVVDTGSYFTFLGKLFILLLIQFGGIGIMTFACFFALFFKGDLSFQGQAYLRDIANTDKLGEVFKIIVKIILFTLSIEFIGAILIFFSIPDNFIYGISDKIKFSVFHSISAFCNAGFSTLSNSLYEQGIRYNYNLQLIIATLIILGGIGFPIMLNFYNYFKIKVKNLLFIFFKIKRYQHIPRIINVNTKIVLITTLILIVFGAAMFYLFEHNHTLKEHSVYGKIVGSFFNSVTPRTAGFNTVDMSALQTPTILIIVFLMWIGASPASTGGGIKTTTFAVTVLNIFSLSKGKDRVEIFRRQIANESIRKASSVILLSIGCAGVGIFLINVFQPELRLLSVVFESFSALGTVGLSMGITSSLSTFSKIVIILLMFIGRVGALTIFVAMIKKVKSLRYKYPEENIFIS